MRNKKPALILVGYFLFLLILFFATDIVLAIPVKEINRVSKINRTQYDNLSSQFDAKVESFSEIQDILFSVEFRGYTFIKTGQESSNKAIKLIFIAEDNSYEVDAEVLERFFLQELFKEKGIVGINHGFITKFSPLNMENGVYKLYIYCYENENTSGFTYTNMVFEKTYRSFKKIQ